MAKSAEQVAEKYWRRRPERPIFYGVCARFSDWRAAVKDRRAGIPAVPALTDEADPSALWTPTTSRHLHRFEGAAERERLQFEIETVGLSQTAEQLRAALDAATEGLRRAVADLEAIPVELDATALARRHSGEAATSESVVAGRRARTHSAVRDAQVAKVEQLTQRIESLQVQLRTTRQNIRSRHSIAAARVRRHHAHSCLRVDHYHRALVRKHPDRDRLLPQLQLGRPALPNWAQLLVSGVPDVELSPSRLVELPDPLAGHSTAPTLLARRDAR